VQTAGASVGMIAGAVIAGVAAMLVALALFTTYRRRRSHSRHVYMGAKGATARTSGSVTAYYVYVCICICKNLNAMCIWHKLHASICCMAGTD